MKQMQITFGDYWNDGHGKYKTFTMNCNKTDSELMQAEKDSEVLTNYQFQTNGKYTTIANDYEESSIKDEVVADLIKLGFDNIVRMDEDTWPLHELEDGIDDFKEFFMRWLKMSTPDLEWEWTDSTIPNAIFNCRGYGMFY